MQAIGWDISKICMAKCVTGPIRSETSRLRTNYQTSGQMEFNLSILEKAMGECSEKVEFLKEFGGDYGYPNSPKNIDQIRSTEFKRLQELVYLDHAGATLYSELQIQTILKDLTTNLYANPHSQSDSGSATSDILRDARQQVLDYCNASPNDYKCIFTSGATSALKFVGESFPWSHESCFMYTMENHNSVLGIREYALNNGATAFAVDIDDFESRRSDSSSFRVTQHPVQRRSTTRNSGEHTDADSLDTCHNLFAFPSECNFSGMKFSLDLVKAVKEDSEKVLEGLPYNRGRWMVLIDAAKGCATQPPNLAKFPADFVAISFYKIFGYPTGLGALIVRTEAAQLLRKKYFSGGTVSASIADIDFYKRRESIEESFEDGTQSFLNIAAVRHGFKIIETLTVSAIARHTTSLATYTRKTLLAMRHVNGANVSVLYGGDAAKISSVKFGPTIAFNLKRPDGSWVGYREVEKLASLSGIQLRTGCFCNPGACSKYLGLSHMDLLSNIEAGHVCWDDHDILGGKPTGAVRVSFGYMSTFEDAKELVHFIKRSFVALPKPGVDRCISNTKSNNFATRGVYLKSITVYPIKSCGGFNVDSWPLCPSGLLHDREWLLKSPSDEILTQKKVPQMSLISTSIDLKQGTMSVVSPNCEKKLQIDLMRNYNTREEMVLQSQRYEVQGYATEINLWFTKAVSRPCSLLRCFSSQSFCPKKRVGNVETCRDVHSKLNFVNEAQFLLISEDSISDLNTRLSSKEKSKGQDEELIHISPMRFRPNIVISGAEPYEEDKWITLTIGNAQFTSFGGCNRCQMINLDPDSGQVHKSKEPLATLASFRRVRGKIMFGILLRYDIPNGDVGTKQELQVGHKMYIQHYR